MRPFLLGCGGVVAGVIVLGVVISIVAAIAISSDPESKAIITGDAEDVTVRVTGNAGFSGSIGSVAGTRTVEGQTPESFVVDGEDSSGIVTAVIQKRDEGGTLTVSLEGCPDGEDHTGTTTAAFGIVTVSC